MAIDARCCSNCGGQCVYVARHVRSSERLTGFELLPGIGTATATPFDVLACETCGFVQFFISELYRKQLAKSTRWTRVTLAADLPKPPTRR